MSGLLLLSPSVFAAEHGGKEHGGTPAPKAKEHGGTTQEHGGQALKVEPSADQIRQAIRDHIAATEQKKGAFTIKDEATGATRTLKLARVHDRVGKTGNFYYSCSDMRDVKNGELLDLDFDVDAKGGQLKVVDERIHKVEGKARYTYDENDNRIPLR
ncbi:MAG: hypothetical protein HY590_01340 [Candidatus Omnitrophica bacterium]|nr:hypothetical protein [Candidatus Omnitrophota bacterium]